MRTYVTLDGTVLDLDAMSADELGFVQKSIQDYRDSADWFEFTSRIFSPGNPLLAPGHRRGAFDEPSMRVLRDLRDRLGIAQGTVRAERGDDDARDPLEDEFITMSQAAEELGVSRMAVHKAAGRGAILATAERPARVSRRSLEAWRINEARQQAGRSRSYLDIGQELRSINVPKLRERDTLEFKRFFDATFDQVCSGIEQLGEDVSVAERAYRWAWTEEPGIPDYVPDEVPLWDWFAGKVYASVMQARRERGVPDPAEPYIRQTRELLEQAARQRPVVEHPEVFERVISAA